MNGECVDMVGVVGGMCGCDGVVSVRCAACCDGGRGRCWVVVCVVV